MFGHLASSQTVARPRSRTVLRRALKLSDVAGWTFSQVGLGRMRAGLWGALRRLAGTDAPGAAAGGVASDAAAAAAAPSVASPSPTEPAVKS